MKNPVQDSARNGVLLSHPNSVLEGGIDGNHHAGLVLTNFFAYLEESALAAVEADLPQATAGVRMHGLDRARQETLEFNMLPTRAGVEDILWRRPRRCWQDLPEQLA